MGMKIIKKEKLELLLNIFRDCKLQNFAKNEFLFQEGDKVEYLDLIMEGKIQIFKYDYNYNEITLKFFSPYNIIAEWAVLNEVPYPASGRFVENSKVYRMPIDEFKIRLEEDISMNHFVIHSLEDKIETLNLAINRGLTMDSFQRVVHFLIFSPDDWKTLKQNQIATLLYLRPETLSRIIKNLKKKGLIDTEKGKIVITDKKGLEENLIL